MTKKKDTKTKSAASEFQDAMNKTIAKHFRTKKMRIINKINAKI